MKGFVLLISGPSGAGKSTLLKRLIEEYKDELYFSISSTTRKPRDGEKDGVNYFFISKEEFEKGIQEGTFLEFARVHDNYYGTSLKHTFEALEQGKIVILDIDVQGFYIAKDILNEIITSVFVTTRDKKELKKRLLKRNTDTIEVVEKRLINAEDEIKELCEYDFLIINEDLDKAYNELRAIFQAQKLKTKTQNLTQFQLQWNKGE
ncbi:guanylate kinase [Campylobacter sp. MIT 99-7217]|uniref:guanylate kinase n=1 Tax=Campylobacter sp. MIT 99-7217 TaxID=535091 RepID=UPI0011595BF3|nr:guanylate kinase [Campylobacter sp. MIT 99-7217]TQR30927.1 guanylate kinase [Campylobacter sp. MIT 99-7217]